MAAGAFAGDNPTCPSGKVATGGGMQVAGEGSADFKTVLRESTPGTIGGGQSLWFTSLLNADTSQHTVQFQTICVNSPTGYEVVSKDLALAARR